MGSADDSETTNKPPKWWEDAAKKALAAGEKTAKIGYIPYQGPDVAAFDPQMVNAMQQANDWSAAFMTPGQAPANAAASLMPAQNFGGGIKGYSSYGGFQDSVAKLRQTYPGLANYLDTFFINPTTGRFPGGGPGGLGGDPVPPPTSPPPVPPPTSPPPPGPGPGPGPVPGPGPSGPPAPGGGPAGGGPPAPADRAPGMRGFMPNGDRWHIDAKGRVIIRTIPANERPRYNGEGGLGNFGDNQRGQARNIGGGFGPTRL